MLLVFGGSLGARALNELAVEAFGEEGPACCTLSASATTSRCASAYGGRGYRLVPFTSDFGAALGAADPALARAGGSVWELAAAGLPAVLVRRLRHRRPSDEERPPLRALGWRRGRPGGGARRRPCPGARAASGRAPAHLDEGGDAQAGSTGRSGHDCRGADRPRRHSRVGASGSPASAVPAFRPMRCSRTLGGPTCPAGTGWTRRI